MKRRLILDSFSPALRQQIAAFSDQEYQEWEQSLGLTDKPEEKNVDADIKEWANSHKKADEILSNIPGFSDHF